MKYRKLNWLILSATLFLIVGVTNGATFVVTKTADTNDGMCDADCSLREAIAQVNANTSGGVTHRIEFSTIFDTPQTIAVATRLYVDYNTRVEIIGRGNRSITLTTTAANTGGVLDINSDFGRVQNLRFADAQNLPGFGGAITSDDGGTLIIEKCLFENNSASDGGAVYNDANTQVEIKDSTFRNNSAEFGGAVYLRAYSQIITGSTFSGNQNSVGNGAAIFFDGYSPTTSTLRNSTFTGNTAANGSTIYNAGGSLVITNVTVAGNSGTNEAVDSSIPPFAQASIDNSIVSQNTGGNTANVTLNAPNLIGGSPNLGALAFNGGETETRALLAGSPAIDAGNSTLSTDQRGAVRPNGTAPDLGAFETDTISANTPTGTNVITSLTSASGSVTLTFSGVSTAGTTTQTPISPSGTPPTGFSFGTGFPAFQISTTASYTPPITICMQVPMSVPLATFNTLVILHFENGAWVPLSPTTRDSMTYVICSTTNSLSPFAAAQNLAPTAANVSISGRVLTSSARGLSNAIVTLTTTNGATQTARTSSFGYYRFDEIEVGQTVVIGVSSKRYQFATRVLTLNEDVADVDFTPLGTEENRK